MVRSFLLLFLCAACMASTPNQRDTLDTAFKKIPFDHWLDERDVGGFRWTIGVPRAELSFHQRLTARVEIKVDGRSLEARRHNAELVFFVQITDHDGTRYQDHGSIELGKLDENVKAANLEYSQAGFFLPGDYRLSVAILDTATGEHATKQVKFRVAPPRHAFLLGWWHDLPPVEFIGNDPSPDSWYLPGSQGRLQWAASVHSPAQLNVILNVAPPLPGLRSRSTPSSGLAALLPTLKVLTETGSSSLSVHVELLDLARRRAVFNQTEVRDLDWPRLKTSLGEANTASIDVHSLSERHHDAQFFVFEVRRLLRGSQQPCVLVVLSASVNFEPDENLDPISTEALPACRTIYIRGRAPVPSIFPFEGEMEDRSRGNRMGAGPMTRNRLGQSVVDQLEPTLKPLSPRVLDVETPEQMTRALAEILKALPAPNGQSPR